MTAFSTRLPNNGRITPKWLALFVFGFVVSAVYYGALLWLVVWLGGKALGPLVS